MGPIRKAGGGCYPGKAVCPSGRFSAPLVRAACDWECGMAVFPLAGKGASGRRRVFPDRVGAGFSTGGFRSSRHPDGKMFPAGCGVALSRPSSESSAAISGIWLCHSKRLIVCFIRFETESKGDFLWCGGQQLLTIQQAMDVYQSNAMAGPCFIFQPCEEKILAMRRPRLQRRCASRFFVRSGFSFLFSEKKAMNT